MSDYSVHNEPDYARTYDEDELVTVRKGDLRCLLDVATGSLDFGSCFLTEEDVECMRTLAAAIGLDPAKVTQRNFTCKYEPHEYYWLDTSGFRLSDPPHWHCRNCGNKDFTTPPPTESEPSA